MRINTDKINGSTMTRWNLVISNKTDRDVRSFLARNGGKKGDLSRFVEETVRRELLRQSIREIREANQNLTPEQAEQLANEAVDWARSTKKIGG